MHLLYICLSTLLWSHANASGEPVYDAKADYGQQGSYPTHPKFFSSTVRAPIVNFSPNWNPHCRDGLSYFITPRGWQVPDPGPMILDEDGTVVWSQHFANEYGGQAYDFKVQKYRGQQCLTFWLGDDTVRGHGAGHYYMLNSSYDIVRTVGATNNLRADLHDFVITPQGTGLITIYDPISADVQPFGRKFGDVWNQAVWDCAIQEIDLETGKLLFEWRASQHLDMKSTYNKLTSKTGDSGTRKNPFDWFHINSVEKDELGNYLISARNVHAIYYIDGKTKEVLWVLGGKQNNFQDLSDGHVLAFAWQHDARFVSIDVFPETYTPPVKVDGSTTRLMTIFDNAAMDLDHTFGTPHSRVLLVEVSYPTPGKVQTEGTRPNFGKYKPQKGSVHASLSQQDMEKVNSINGSEPRYAVRIIREYVNPQQVRSGTQGNAQLLAQGKAKDPRIFAGYGINAVMTKFASSGDALCNVHFGAITSWHKGDVQSYRAFKFPWTGRPRQPPAVVLKRGKVYMSWNGATNVHEWALQVSADKSAEWKLATKISKYGFETSFDLDALDKGVESQFLRVAALDQNGQTLENGLSNVIERGYMDLVVWPRVMRSAEHPLLRFGFMLVGGTVLLWLFRKVYRRSASKRKLATPNGILGNRRVD